MKIATIIVGVIIAVILLVAFQTSNSSLKENEQEIVDYFGSYSFIDKNYGTKTKMTIKKNIRRMVTNALPNHETGEFPNSGNPNVISEQKGTYEFPLNPVFTGVARWAREPGIALNGIKFEPQTAEVVICESGENYRIEAIQNLIDLGLDFNHAHVQPTGAYHYHGVPTSLVTILDKGQDLIHIGFAMDGFPIYYSTEGSYKSSYRLIDVTREGTDCNYTNPHQSMMMNVNTLPDGTFGNDWEYIPGFGDLDECNGMNINGSYAYMVTDGFPYVGRCLKGEFKEENYGPPPGVRPPRGGGPGGHIRNN